MQPHGLNPGERRYLFQHLKASICIGPEAGWLHAAAKQLLMQQQCFKYAASLAACCSKA